MKVRDVPLPPFEHLVDFFTDWDPLCTALRLNTNRLGEVSQIYSTFIIMIAISLLIVDNYFIMTLLNPNLGVSPFFCPVTAPPCGFDHICRAGCLSLSSGPPVMVDMQEILVLLE